VLGGGKTTLAPALPLVRSARGPLPTLGEEEAAPATATLRPPGAVPPPPRGLPVPLALIEPASSTIETPPPVAESAVADSAVTEGTKAKSAAAQSAVADSALGPQAERALDSTFDVIASPSQRAAQQALIEQSKMPVAERPAVPAPGLYIADEPLEPRPPLPSSSGTHHAMLAQMKWIVLSLGGATLLLAAALFVLLWRRPEALSPSAVSPLPSSSGREAMQPGCRLILPPLRISSKIERSVPIHASALGSGKIALAIATTPITAQAWTYDPITGGVTPEKSAAAGSGEISSVKVESDQLVVDRSASDFAFPRALAPGLTLGVGAEGLLRRAADGGTGVVWSFPAGAKLTPPRAAATSDGYFVALRAFGPEGKIMAGWLTSAGAPRTKLEPIAETPTTLGTPNVSASASEAFAVFAARSDKSSPFRVYAARARQGEPPGPARAVELPAAGGGAIAPALLPADNGRFVLQWTDGRVGEYAVRASLLDRELRPIGQPLRVSPQGANAGQGTLVSAGPAIASFFIQTTAGFDELWGATFECR
jgi:hypothetical protein